MKVLLYLKDDPGAEPIEREAVDAREILADPDTIYTMTPGKPDGVPHKIIIEGMSPDGMTFVNNSGLTTEEMAGMSFEEVGVRLDLKAMNERDANALRLWHGGLAERRKRLAAENPPQPGEKRDFPESARQPQREAAPKHDDHRPSGPNPAKDRKG